MPGESRHFGNMLVDVPTLTLVASRLRVNRRGPRSRRLGRRRYPDFGSTCHRRTRSAANSRCRPARSLRRRRGLKTPRFTALVLNRRGEGAAQANQPAFIGMFAKPVLDLAESFLQLAGSLQLAPFQNALLNEFATLRIFDHQRNIRSLRIARINFEGFFNERQRRLPILIGERSRIVDQSAAQTGEHRPVLVVQVPSAAHFFNRAEMMAGRRESLTLTQQYSRSPAFFRGMIRLFLQPD